jgi:hypothetical protein
MGEVLPYSNSTEDFDDGALLEEQSHLLRRGYGNVANEDSKYNTWEWVERLQKVICTILRY